MKNYYYFLGINEDASTADIRQVFRKLSLKYHPDKNPNDEYFAARFREIQEAYDILSDVEKRRIYDENLTHQQRSYRPTLPPSIKTFSASKIRIRKDENLTINWQTNNADIVKIVPFGLEKGYGERTFKIKEFKDGQFQLLLHATNSLLNKTVVRGLTIFEIAGEGEDIELAEQPFEQAETKRSSPHALPAGRIYRIVLAIIFLMLALWLLAETFAS